MNYRPVYALACVYALFYVVLAIRVITSLH